MCLDDTWKELLLWFPAKSPSNDFIAEVLPHSTIIDFNHNPSTLKNHSTSGFERIVFFTSNFFDERVTQMKRLLVESGVPECAIVSTVSPATTILHFTSGNSSVTQENIYESVCIFLEPVKATIYFYPIQCIDLLTNNPGNRVELKILASTRFRNLAPLTLAKLGLTENSEYQSIFDIPAADLPDGVKTELKQFAHEIAQCLVFDLGLDPTNSLYSQGRTASLIGHNLLTIVEQLQKSVANDELRDHLLTLSPEQIIQHPLKPASLILIDRWEDLYTPVSMTGDFPLAHRVMNTLKKAQPPTSSTTKTIDVQLTTPLHLRLQEILSSSSISSDTSTSQLQAPNPFDMPMSAVRGSAFKTAPSLRYNPPPTEVDLETTTSLRHQIMAANEEEGRSILCEELKHRIFLENGSLPPPKKRGVGAEISALVQSLLESPGASAGNTTRSYSGKYNPIVCSKTERLIALSYAIIEAMQRSSAKQFTTLCQWKLSFDDRIQREADLLVNIFQQEDFDVAFAVLLNFFLPKKTATESKTPTKTSAKTKQREVAEETKSTAIDVIHILLMFLGLMTLCRYKPLSTTSFTYLLNRIAEYSLEASVEELDYWKVIGILNETSYKDILEWKTVLPTTDLDRSEVVNIITLILESHFQKLRELLQMYNVSLQKLREKPGFTHWQHANPFDLMNDFQTKERMQINRNTNGNQTPQGLISRMIEDCLLHKLQHSPVHSPQGARSSSALLRILEHIENPLQHLAKKGYGLLSRGLGRLGFGSENEEMSTAHPGSNDTIIIFVIGGLAYKEVGQVQKVLQEYRMISDSRIILMSNHMICAEEILQLLF